MASTIRVALGVDGAKEFREAMDKSNAAIKNLGSELKLTTTQFGNAEKSEAGLKSQNDVLERTVLTLNEKLAEQEKMLGTLGKSYKEGSPELIKFQTEINKTKTAIAEAENKIKSNNEEIKNLGKEEKKASKETSTFGSVLKANLASEAIVAGVKALGNAVVELGKKMLSAATDAAYWADDLNTQAKVTGISTEQLQKYAFAAEQVDVSVDTIAGSMTKLTKNMNAAKGGTGAAAEAFAELGISVTDANGELRSNDDVFNEAIKALGKIENETQRDALAMEIFGKSAQELNPLILGGVEALDEYSAMAERFGLILGQDDLDSLNQISDAMDTFKATASAAGKIFMVGFAQPIADAINKITGYMQRLTLAFQNNGFEGMLAVAQSILTEVIGEIDAILPELFAKGTEILMNIVQGIIEALPEILNTATQLIVTIANGISASLPELLPALVETIIAIADGLVANMPMLIEAALQLILGLAEGLIKALPELTKKAPQIIIDLVKTLLKEMPRVLEVGVEIVKGVWEGIKSMASWLWEQVSGFFSSIVDGVKETLGIHSPSKVFAGIGKNMALGLGEGFDDAMYGVSKSITASVAAPAVTAVGNTNGGGEIVLNITSTLDGNILARNQYRYNAREIARHGGSLVGGMA